MNSYGQLVEESPQKSNRDAPQQQYQSNSGLPRADLPILKKTKQKSHDIEKHVERHKPVISGTYDPDWIPDKSPQQQATMIEKAQKHLEASQVGTPIHVEKPELCSCCMRQIQRAPLPLGVKNVELAFLGAGYPLFFDFIKHCILFLLIIVLSAGSFDFFSNSQGKDCSEEKECQSNWVTMFSFLNKRHDSELVTLQSILNIFTIIAIILLLQYLRFEQRIMNQKCDMGDITAADYTIQISNIPNDIPAHHYKAYLKKVIESTYQQKQDHNGKILEQVVVSNINLAFQLHEVQTIINEKQQKIQILQERLNIMYKTGVWPDHPTEYKIKTEAELRKKIEELEEQKDAKMKEYQKAKEDKVAHIFTGIAFVSFQKESHKERVIEENNPSFYEKYILRLVHQPLILQEEQSDGNHKNVKVQVCQAPDATDIIWENLEYSKTQRLIRKLLGQFLVIIALVICFIIIYQLALMQKTYSKEYLEMTKQQDSNQKQIINTNQTHETHFFLPVHGETYFLDDSNQQQQTNEEEIASKAQQINMIAVAIGFIIIALNKGLSFVMKMLIPKELHMSHTDQNISLASKIIYSNFFNAVLQTFMIKIIIPWAQEGGTFKDAVDAIISPSGLVINQHQVILQSVLVTNLVNLVDHNYIIKYIQQWWVLNKKKGTLTYTQEQINGIFEYPEFAISESYAFVMNTMLMIAFYAPLIPIGLGYSMLSLGIAYFIYKRMLLRKRTIKTALNIKLSMQMTDMLELFLPIYTIGNIIFSTMIANPEAEKDLAHMKFGFLSFGIDIYYNANYFGKIGVLVGILNYILPTAKINRLLFTLDEEDWNHVLYDDAVKHNFPDNNYETENPVTKEEAILKLQQNLMNNKQYNSNDRNGQYQQSQNIPQQQLYSSNSQKQYNSGQKNVYPQLQSPTNNQINLGLSGQQQVKKI